MSNVVIKVEGLSKKYLIKHEQKESYQIFQDMLLNGGRQFVNALNPFNKNTHENDNSVEEFRALDDTIELEI